MVTRPNVFRGYKVTSLAIQGYKVKRLQEIQASVTILHKFAYDRGRLGLSSISWSEFREYEAKISSYLVNRQNIYLRGCF